MNSIKPQKLRAGDTVGICSPSGTIAHKRELFEQAKAGFEKATGLNVLVADNAFAKHHYSAGTPEERLHDFHSLIKHPEVKAVLFSAGGDTAIDLVEHIDYDAVTANPKIISGISDATTLLSPITAKTGLITFLGLEFLDFAEHDMAYTVESIQRAWFDGNIGTIQPNPNWAELRETRSTYHTWQTIRGGSAEGRLIGGNSCSFIQLLGTPYELSLDPAILFLETYKLPKKQIHKALMQLKVRGVFDRIQGLIIGYCLESETPEVVGNDQPLNELVLEITKEYSFPIMHIGEIGHYVENTLQPFGALARMNADTKEITITEPVTI